MSEFSGGSVADSYGRFVPPEATAAQQRAADYELMRAASGARVRTWVNSVGLLVDMLPTVADPSSALDVVGAVSRTAGMVPHGVRRFLGPVGRLVTRVERWDPTPDVHAALSILGVGVEVAAPVVPSSVMRLGQIMIDRQRIRDSRGAARRVAIARRAQGRR